MAGLQKKKNYSALVLGSRIVVFGLLASMGLVGLKRLDLTSGFAFGLGWVLRGVPGYDIDMGDQ